MYSKKLLSIGFIALLVLSTAMVTVTANPWDTVVDDPHAANAIWVDPNSYLTSLELDTLAESNTFTVDVLINVSVSSPLLGLYGFEYKLSWDESLIDVVDIQYHAPAGWTSVFEVANYTRDFNSIPGKNETHVLSLTTLAGAAFQGVMSLCTYVFHVETSVFEPSPNTIGTLDIWEDILVDKYQASEIAHSTDDGDYRICAIPIPSPELAINPPKVQGVCGEPFNITIDIRKVVAQHDFWGWEAKVSFNTTHLTALNSYEGPFLPSFQGPNGTYYINIINNTVGIILTGGGFLGNHTAPTSVAAWRTLAILEFNASFQTIAPDIQSSLIELYDVKLVGRYPNGTLYDIEHTVVHGATYNVPYKTVGWSLDSFTDHFRKKCWTPFIGEGINVTADAYEPQDLVILYAYLQYNFEPEAYKLVSFEIHGPANPYYNITIIRTAWTNASGIAMINFTIPGSGIPNWQEMVFGKWSEYEAAQVKIYEKPHDWLWFEVGWIVETLDVTVLPPEGAKKSEMIEITVVFKNIMMIPKWVLFTVVVYDELLDPIQWDAWWVLAAPATYAHNPIPTYNSTVVFSHIVDYAHVGTATVYVNAFTDFPSLCGCPYCPEITTTFFVLATADP